MARTKSGRSAEVMAAMQSYVDFMNKHCGRAPTEIVLLPEQFDRVKPLLNGGKYNGIPVKSVRAK